MYNNQGKRDIRAQSVGAIVSEHNIKNLLELEKKIHHIESQNKAELSQINNRLTEALKCVKNVSDFVGTPDHILGSPTTKHGEIAEQVNVHFRNAERILEGKFPDATFDGVGRTAPEDFLVNGIAVQSKYINGASNSLSHVINHLNKYESIGFGRDNSYYIIPKDQYELIREILSGDSGELSQRSVKAIEDKIEEIERLTGKTFTEAVHSGNVDYAEVQQGAIHKTIEKEKQALNKGASEQRERSYQKSEQDKAKANVEAAPSWSKAGKTAIGAAAFSGSFELASGIYKKCKNGKKLSEFSIDDWKELGIDTAKASAEGGISGLALYGLTNFTSIPAPAGAAGISLAFGIADLAYQRYQGTISDSDFIEGCRITAINSAVSALGAAIGQELIPIPVLGAFIGSFLTGKAMETLCGDGFELAVKDATASLLRSERNIEDMLIAYRNLLQLSDQSYKEMQAKLKRIKEKETELDKSICEMQSIVEVL